MKMLIVGSNKPPEGSQSPEGFPSIEFKDACNQIGEQLCNRGWELIIGSYREHMADRHVLEGYQNAKGRRKRITLLRPEKGHVPASETLREEHKRNITPKTLPGPWPAARVRQMQEADAVLLIGGRENTLMAGYIAPTMERPVIAVGAFDGSAKELWHLYQGYYDELGDDSDVAFLREKWRPENAKIAVDAAEALIAKRSFHTTLRFPKAVPYLFLLLSLLGVWMVLFVEKLQPLCSYTRGGGHNRQVRSFVERSKGSVFAGAQKRKAAWIWSPSCRQVHRWKGQQMDRSWPCPAVVGCGREGWQEAQ